MKHFIAFLLLLIASSMPETSVCNAGNVIMPALTIPVIKQPVTDEPIIKEDDDEFGKRKPSRPIACSISSEGVVIAGVADEILTFEIAYAEAGGCLLCTDDEQEFIEVLATLPADTYQIVFLTDRDRYEGTNKHFYNLVNFCQYYKIVIAD